MAPVKILVVDDEDIMLTLLKAYLKRFACTISTATNATDAIKCIENTPFDLVITDLQLGETNGLDVVRKTKKLSPKTLVFMMSGCREAEQIIAAFHAGADDYLLKPFSMDSLLEHLQNKGLQLKQTVRTQTQPGLQRKGMLCQKYLHSVNSTLYNEHNSSTSQKDVKDLTQQHCR